MSDLAKYMDELTAEIPRAQYGYTVPPQGMDQRMAERLLASPVLARIIADAEQRGRVEAVASVAPVVEKWQRYLEDSNGDWSTSIQEISVALGGAA